MSNSELANCDHLMLASFAIKISCQWRVVTNFWKGGALDVENRGIVFGSTDAIDPKTSTLLPLGAARPRCSEALVAQESTHEYWLPLVSVIQLLLLHGKKFVNSQEKPLGIGRSVLSAWHRGGVLRRKGFHLPTDTQRPSTTTGWVVGSLLFSLTNSLKKNLYTQRRIIIALWIIRV